MRARFITLTLLVAPAASPALAQGDLGPAPGRPATSACIAALPDSAFTRIPVYAALAMNNPAQRIPPSAANLLPTIVGRAEMELNAKPPILAHGEPLITWRDLGGALVVTWRRSGALAWRVREDSSSVERLRPAGIRLLARGLAAADSAGEAMMLWPEGLTGDSIAFEITLASPVIDSAGKVHPIEARLATPAFSIAAPRESDVRVIKSPRTAPYPQYLVNAGVQGRVLFNFVVDTLGMPDTTTIRDDWPDDRPRLTGQLGRYYAAFLRSARSGLGEARFAPARIGGCAVPQRVKQPFTWKIREALPAAPD